MKWTTWLLSPVIAVLLCGPMIACPTRTRIVTAAAVTQTAVVTNAVVIPVAQFVAVPLYTANYSPVPAAPTAAPAPAPAANPDLKAILDALKSLDARVRSIEGKAGSPAVPGDGKPPKAASASLSALWIFSNKCAACHDKGVAGEKGGGLVLLDAGKVAALTDRQARKVLSASYAGRMPPKSSGVSLTDEEVATIATFVDNLK